MKEKTPKGGDGRQRQRATQTEKRESQSNGRVYLTALGAFEIYSVWSLALNADIKIITAVC